MTLATPIPPPTQAGPAWAIARLFPNQGQWSEGDYLSLNRYANGLVELSDGQVEVLEMPTRSHQRIVLHLRDAIKEFASRSQLGEAIVAPYPVRVRQDKFREPDILFVLTEHSPWLTEDFAAGADLVVEVVSGDRERDLIVKRNEYAEAGISEYWIVDPKEKRIRVLTLQERRYVDCSEATEQGTVHSKLLPGFTVDVKKVFDAAGA